MIRIVNEEDVTWSIKFDDDSDDDGDDNDDSDHDDDNDKIGS